MHLGATALNNSRADRVVPLTTWSGILLEIQSKITGIASVVLEQDVIRNPTRVEPWNKTASEFSGRFFVV